MLQKKLKPMTLSRLEKYYQRLFKTAPQIFVNNRLTVEIFNTEYVLKCDWEKVLENMEPITNAEEIVERNYIINRAIDMKAFFEDDGNTRRAGFVNNYDGYDNHCLSYFHFIIRNGKLYMTVLIRSQNFDSNFKQDNQTLLLAYRALYWQLQSNPIFSNLNRGGIVVKTISLHRYL